MKITGINHLAFITHDMEKTIRYYRDLLGMTLEAGWGTTVSGITSSAPAIRRSPSSNTTARAPWRAKATA